MKIRTDRIIEFIIGAIVVAVILPPILKKVGVTND
tara:strand:- start:644 stop:748 length:105 start_codon:yes stop_codon:yes gene_type:complete